MTALATAEAQIDRNPSLPQIACGNYRKGKYRIHGLVVSIENPRGSIRSAKNGSWKVRMPAPYGYVRGTSGADGQQLDCFLGPHCRSPLVYVVDQMDANTGKWDEHKCFFGFASPRQVKRIYEAAFSDGRAKDRLGALHEMTVAQFKDWLAHGDTTKPVMPAQYRASGGRVRMAEGGTPNPFDRFDSVPPFDPSKPYDRVPSWNETTATGAPPFDPTKPFEAAHDSGDQGLMHAFGHGAASGATFGFSDELAGLDAAAPKVAGHDIPDLVGPVPTRMLAGAGRLAKQWLTGETQASEDYTRARDAERQAQKEGKAHHPYAYGAGEFAGSLPAMAVLPEAGLVRGAGVGSRLARGAVTGAEYGGLSGAGEGEDLGQRVENGASGALGGGAAGFVGSGAGELLNLAGRTYIQPMVSTVRGWMNPEAEAARRVATALQRDSEMMSAGTAKGLTPREWIAARNAGEPVTLADLGAGNTQALLRSAANTSPEGRAMLEQVIENRFLDQSERVADTVRDLIPGGANASQTADDLVKAYDAGRKPLYKKAYDEGDKEIKGQQIDQLMGSPTFVDAMRRASTSGKDRAITEGLGAMRQGATVENGIVKFTKGPNGVPTYPNLQYWDAVKRELDDMAGAAFRSGEKGRGSVISNMSNTLRAELDKQVPSYANARGFASQFFGENNALEAGRKLAGKKVEPAVIQQAMSKMKPDERKLFQEGYASDWADRVISNISETRDVTKAMFNSPNERARAEAVFSPAGMAKIQARMTLETIMDGARKAMGNSTTARQLIEAGLAGGALGGYEAYRGGFDPLRIAGATGAGIGVRLGAGKLLGAEVAAGARKLIGKVDARTARNVAELLTSDDPRKLKQGLGIAMGNQRIMNGLRRVANALSVSAVAPGGREAAIAMAPDLQRVVGAQAAPSWDETRSSNPFDRFDTGRSRSQPSAPAFNASRSFEAVRGT